MINKNENLFISVDAIGYFLMGKFIDSQADKNLINGIKRGFESLKKEEGISILEQSRNNFIIGFNVLRFFVNIIGTINGNSKSWHMTQDDMVLNWGFSKNTINEYLCKLEELKLLYTFRSKARKTDKPYHKVGNVYGRYEDKNLVIQYRGQGRYRRYGKVEEWEGSMIPRCGFYPHVNHWDNLLTAPPTSCQ